MLNQNSIFLNFFKTILHSIETYHSIDRLKKKEGWIQEETFHEETFHVESTPNLSLSPRGFNGSIPGGFHVFSVNPGWLGTPKKKFRVTCKRSYSWSTVSIDAKSYKKKCLSYKIKFLRFFAADEKPNFLFSKKFIFLLTLKVNRHSRTRIRPCPSDPNLQKKN